LETEWKAAVEEARAREEADKPDSSEDAETGDDYEEEMWDYQ